MTTEKEVCQTTLWTDIWHPQQCGKPAKYRVENPSSGIKFLCCGIHVRNKRTRGWTIEELKP